MTSIVDTSFMLSEYVGISIFLRLKTELQRHHVGMCKRKPFHGTKYVQLPIFQFSAPVQIYSRRVQLNTNLRFQIILVAFVAEALHIFVGGVIDVINFWG